MRVVVPSTGIKTEVSELTRQDIIDIFKNFTIDVEAGKANIWDIDSVFTKVFRSQLKHELLLLPSQLIIEYMKPTTKSFSQPYFRYFTAYCYSTIDFGDPEIIKSVINESIHLARNARELCSVDLNNTKQDRLATYTSMIHASIQMLFYIGDFGLAKQLCQEWFEFYIRHFSDYEIGAKSFWQKSLPYSKMLVFSTIFLFDCSALRKAIKPIIFSPASQSFPKQFLKTPEFMVISLENTVAIGITWRIKKTIHSSIYTSKNCSVDLSKLLFSIGQYAFRLEGDNQKHPIYIDRLKKYIFDELSLPFVSDAELLPLMCYWDKISGLVDSKGRNCEA